MDLGVLFYMLQRKYTSTVHTKNKSVEAVRLQSKDVCKYC
jgi:hypothetical protein